MKIHSDRWEYNPKDEEYILKNGNIISKMRIYSEKWEYNLNNSERWEYNFKDENTLSEMRI